MEKDLVRLIEKEIVTLEELEKIEAFEEVAEIENYGNSVNKVGYTWFNVKTIDGEYSVYADRNYEKGELLKMKLSDIKTLQDVAKEYDISFHTLQTRLKSKKFDLIENEDYRKMGKGQSILLSPEGVKKIVKI